MSTMLQLPEFAAAAPVVRYPVAIDRQRQNVGSIILNCNFQELLGPRTSGALLNVGAGTASDTYAQHRMFAASTYHTLESRESGIPATYVGTATDMSAIADATYDWVISTSVLEHVDDPWAAAREQIRVVKPGGFIYCLVPYFQIMHPHETFGDYWRFTPQGLRKLFSGCVVREIEAWGSSPSQPNAFAVLFQKPDGAATAARERYYWLEFRNDELFELVIPNSATEFDWPLYELKAEPMHLAQQLNGARDQYHLQAQITVTHEQILQRYKSDFARRIGSLGCRKLQSYLNRI